MDAADLAAVPLFADLDEEDLAAVAGLMREVRHDEGDLLAEQGDLSYMFFVVLDGTVSVRASGRHLADLGPGDHFGEEGILAKRRRSADVRANSPVRLAVLAGWDLRALVEQYPRIRYEIDLTIDDRSGIRG